MGEIINIPLVNKNFSEINPVVCGEQRCSPGHSYGPAIRKYTIIHHVLSGKGTLTTENGTYEITQGKAFIINPGEVTLYRADNDDPWHYIWIGFDGSFCEKFTALSPVIESYGRLFKEMLNASDFKETAEEYLAGKVFELYARLFAGKGGGKEDYISKIENFVESNYNGSCEVSDIAKALNLERHYLSRLFKQKTGKTLKEFITKKRMEEAKHHLSEGHSITVSARMSGYKDQFLFSNMFKKLYGVSPTEWKIQNGIFGKSE